MVGFRLAGLFSVVVAVILSATSCVAGPLTVNPGYDLTVTGLSFFEFPGPTVVSFQGEPLHLFDFGGIIGVKDVLSTDTIIQRTQALNFADFGTDATTNIVVTAVNLRSVFPVSLGAAGDPQFYYATTDGLGTGTMNVKYNNADGGTWTNTFTFNIFVHTDSPTGPTVVGPISKTFMGHGSWTTHSGPANFVVPGVNDGNFFLDCEATHDDGNGTALHIVSNNPEPATWILGVLGAVGVCFARRRSVAV